MHGNKMRTCEGCHGMESLHNIQADSDGSGDIVVGGELYGYGHVGRDAGPGDSDCWGCHGFDFAGASAPGSGPTAPFISNADVISVPSGIATTVTLNGLGFINTLGAFEWKSNIVLTAADGSATVLTPDTINTCQCTVTIPGSLTVGNYSLQAVKDGAVSNPVIVSIKPPVVIDNTACAACSSDLDIYGSGFGDAPPAGSGDYLNVVVDGVEMEIVRWTDTKIKVRGSSCNYGEITVNALYGSASK
jgi:hypothetical protein